MADLDYEADESHAFPVLIVLRLLIICRGEVDWGPRRKLGWQQDAQREECEWV